jgi:hypothetical protein
MKNSAGSAFRLVVPVLLGFAMAPRAEEEKTPPEGAIRAGDPHWKLVWSDEFDAPGLPDAKKWSYEVGQLRNREAQYYTKERKENARVENGTLVIEDAQGEARDRRVHLREPPHARQRRVAPGAHRGAGQAAGRSRNVACDLAPRHEHA